MTWRCVGHAEAACRRSVNEQCGRHGLHGRDTDGRMFGEPEIAFTGIHFSSRSLYDEVNAQVRARPLSLPQWSTREPESRQPLYTSCLAVLGFWRRAAVGCLAEPHCEMLSLPTSRIGSAVSHHGGLQRQGCRGHCRRWVASLCGRKRRRRPDCVAVLISKNE
jgi:hypothetical protein